MAIEWSAADLLVCPDPRNEVERLEKACERLSAERDEAHAELAAANAGLEGALKRITELDEACRDGMRAMAIVESERDKLRASLAATEADRDSYRSTTWALHDQINALRDELAAEREALEPFAKLNVTRFMTDGIKYVFRVDAKDIRRARARIDALVKGGKGGPDK